jgi:hypothetical protein
LDNLVLQRRDPQRTLAPGAVPKRRPGREADYRGVRVYTSTSRP